MRPWMSLAVEQDQCRTAKQMWCGSPQMRGAPFVTAKRRIITFQTSEMFDFREGPKDSPQLDPQKEHQGPGSCQVFKSFGCSTGTFDIFGCGKWPVICQAGWNFVAQLRSWLPGPIGGILWFGVDDASFSVHAPFHGSLALKDGPWSGCMCAVNMSETVDLQLPRLPFEVLNASLEY